MARCLPTATLMQPIGPARTPPVPGNAAAIGTKPLPTRVRRIATSRPSCMRNGTSIAAAVPCVRRRDPLARMRGGVFSVQCAYTLPGTFPPPLRLLQHESSRREAAWPCTAGTPVATVSTGSCAPPEVYPERGASRRSRWASPRRRRRGGSRRAFSATAPTPQKPQHPVAPQATAAFTPLAHSPPPADKTHDKAFSPITYYFTFPYFV